MKIMITGVAGFIGSTLALRLLARGDSVYGVDNMNDYYDVRLKEARLKRFADHKNFKFEKLDIADRAGMAAMFKREKFDAVMNLAAQAGVRYSIENPHAYIDANVVGFCNVLEGCRHSGVKHLVFASSSSVYGANTNMPFSEHNNVDHPVSLYAATKKANEAMAHSYAHLWNLPTTMFRFFTVYGPWGRPDMALFKFTRGILEGTPIDIYNDGEMYRDFTFVKDLVRAIRLLIDAVPERPANREDVAEGDSLSPVAPFRVVNIGNSDKVRLLDFIEAIEIECGREAIRNYLPMQKGDVPATWAEAGLLHRLTGYRPATDVREGVRAFVAWYRDHYRI